MSGGVMVVVGLLLALAGVWSIRMAFLAAGFGAAWLLASAFDASLLTSLLVALAGAVLLLGLAIFASKVMFGAVGAIVGCVAGARLFLLLDGGEASPVLALVFVPAVACCFGVVANRWRRRFLGWACAIGGSGLVLSGLGLLAPSVLDFLYRPTSVTGQVVSAGSWVVLAALARLAQRRVESSGLAALLPGREQTGTA